MPLSTICQNLRYGGSFPYQGERCLAGRGLVTLLADTGTIELTRLVEAIITGD